VAARALGAVAVVAGVAAGCGARPRGAVAREARDGEVERIASGGARSAGRVVRVALAEAVPEARVGATGASSVVGADAGLVLGRAGAGAEWTVERRGDQLRALGPAGGTSWTAGPLVVRAEAPDAFVTYGGRRWRGELWLHAGPGRGLTVVDRLPAEEYLRGVVPLELAGGDGADLAAVQAQAVAARSYTYSRLAEFLPRAAAQAHARFPFDVRATVRDQVYGGVGAERPGADRAVATTAGLVLRYEGALVSAPYHSACGGSTAAAEELWGADPAPYLRAVSDRVPGTDRVYCDAAPRYRWTRTWAGDELAQVLARYLRANAAGAAPAGAVGVPRGLDVLERTPSGRAGSVAVRTDAGRYVLRGNAIRFTLRGRAGDILPSTYFTATAEADGAGRVARLVVRGAGNGHGVGMCQWGAVGRARAGQDFRTILRTYYPGTTVEPVE
jgi:stage II sporulation protein D